MSKVSKPILIFCFFMVAFSFKTTENNAESQKNPSKLSSPAPCPQKFFDLAKAAVVTCENQLLNETTNCMADEMKKYKLQAWNVFCKSSEDVADTVSYWIPSACIVKLQNQGKLYKRSYLLWQSLKYNNTDANSTDENQISSEEIGQSQPLLKKFTVGSRSLDENLSQSNPKEKYNPLRDDCQQWKVLSVKNIFQYCDLPGNQRTGQCIKDRIKRQMSEYWGAYVKTTLESAITFWYAECYTTVQGFGKYSRYIRVWE